MSRDTEDHPEFADAREGSFDDQLTFPAPFVEAPELIESFVKRSGQVVPFRRRNIAEAIWRAAQSIGGEDRDRADSIASGVVLYLAKKLPGTTPTAEQVQDAVERVLIHMGHVRTALAFARHREKRTRLQHLERGDIQALLRELRGVRKGESGADQEPGELFVRTSDERIVDWRRDRITETLVRETGLPRETAEMIAIEVERQIADAKVKTLTASLVRELANARLLERGLQEHVRKHMRIGVPLYDAEQIICMPNRGASEREFDPLATDLVLADRVKREYALSRVFSDEVAEAHLSGEIHLHDLGCIDRMYSGNLTPHAIARFLLSSKTPPGAARRVAETVLPQLGQFSARLNRHFSSVVHWDCINVCLAPLLMGVDQPTASLHASMAALALRHQGPAGHPVMPQSAMTLAWLVPADLRERLCAGEGADAHGGTGAFEPKVQQVAYALASAAAGHARESSAAPAFAVRIAVDAPSFAIEGFPAWLDYAGELVAGGVPVEFVFTRRHAPAGPGQRPPVEIVIQRVTLNLVRAAIESDSENAFYERVERLVDLAVRAHSEKRRFIQRLLAFKGTGPISALAAEFEGQPLLNLDAAVWHAGINGMNECVERFTGSPLHRGAAGLDMGLRIAARIESICGAAAVAAGLRLTPAQAMEESVAQRFASLDLHTCGERASALVKANPLTQELSYTPGACLPASAEVSPAERARIEGQFHRVLSEGAITRVRLCHDDASGNAVAGLVQKAFYQTENRHIAFR